jgi:hypothetical protein
MEWWGRMVFSSEVLWTMWFPGVDAAVFGRKGKEENGRGDCLLSF